MNFLANIIYIFHLLVILFVLFAPFSDKPALYLLHVVFCASLLIHWYFNTDECSLTRIEAQLRNLDNVSEGFTYKFISPMYNISQTEWSKLCSIIVISLMSISIFKLYQSNVFSRSLECFNLKTNDPEFADKPLKERFVIGLMCFKELLSW